MHGDIDSSNLTQILFKQVMKKSEKNVHGPRGPGEVTFNNGWMSLDPKVKVMEDSIGKINLDSI